ncbi:ATP-binding protein [Spirillospora sp. NPDC047279]|uniref:ATP-binding protein n=1 Tax=Spirillospora sp. NPDC047279 TaxID=3155478 RepID=UPI0033E57859
MCDDFTLVLDPVPEAARAARELVDKAFAAEGLESYDARLVVTELFSNAARVSRKGQHVVVRVVLEPGRRVVEVWDQCDDPLVMRVAGADDEGGRGLFVIDELVDDWGVRALSSGGKVVWAALHASGLLRVAQPARERSIGS